MLQQTQNIQNMQNLPNLLSIKELARAVLIYDNPDVEKMPFYPYQRIFNSMVWRIRRLIECGKIPSIQRGKGMMIQIRKQDAIDFIENGLRENDD